MKLIERRKVAASLTDFNANLSVLGTLRVVEDAITEFMGDLKIDGLTAKREYNAVWVFAKTRIKFLKSIAWNQEYAVTCFISKISNVTIYIDVSIKNTDDELCAYSRTELCPLDLATGRIRKVSTVGVDDKISAEAPLCDILFTKIDTEGLTAVEQVKVKFTGIDFVGHTNNKEYARFILDTYSVSELANSPIREMEIVYSNQSYEGDDLTVLKCSHDNKDIFAIRKDDKVIAKSEITLERL